MYKELKEKEDKGGTRVDNDKEEKMEGRDVVEERKGKSGTGIENLLYFLI